ncbi:GNAT family N-acetyltransferase [Pasteurellaceae bacterium LIM206]|nr:GNAT family N-acetyltransferase [Pasteurellaceae bacterium LIM206]
MIIRKAQPRDLPQIVAIYNQAIPSRRVTADLSPVTIAQRQEWFDFHLNHDRYPIWVITENDEANAAVQASPESQSAVSKTRVSAHPPADDSESITVSQKAANNSRILGWCSFSPFYPRAAFDNTVEISLYLDQTVKGRGIGSRALQFMQSQMAARYINTLMAYVIEENHISRRTFEKQGFTQWGRYPNIANMGDSLQTFLMYGYQTGIE